MKRDLWSVRFDTRPPSPRLPVLFHVYHSSFVTSDYRNYGKDRKGESYVFKMTLSGKGHFRKGDRVYHVERGQAVIFQTNDKTVEYWRSEDSDGPWEFIFCSCFGSTLGPLFREIITSCGPLLEVPMAHPVIQRLMAFRKQRDRVIAMTYADNSRFVFDLMALFVETAPARRRESRDVNTLVQRTVELIHQAAPAELSVSGVARDLGVTPEHLIRQCRTQLGQTPYQMITAVRLDLARQLLKDSDLSVKAIAAHAGVPRESFSAWFRRNLDTTPTEYRAACR